MLRSRAHFTPAYQADPRITDRRSGEEVVGRRERRVERLKGIEPSSSDWKSEALPLSYSRETLGMNPSSGALTCGYARIKSW